MARPFCLCLAGPNGSGKSTLTAQLRGMYADVGMWIDPDAVGSVSPQHRPPLSEEESRRQFMAARNLRVEYALSRQNFAFETVFSHGSNVAFIRALKAVDYEVHLAFIATESADINVARVMDRVAKNGHDVPEDKIRERHLRSLLLLSLSIAEFDQVWLYDNSQMITTADQAGRLIGQVVNDAEGARQPQIRLTPPIPAWVTTYALAPYSKDWRTHLAFGQAQDRFKLQELHFDRTTQQPNSEAGRRLLLEQFLWPPPRRSGQI